MLSQQLDACHQASSAAAAEEALLRHQLSAALRAQVDACKGKEQQLQQCMEELKTDQQEMKDATEMMRSAGIRLNQATEKLKAKVEGYLRAA